MELIDRIQISPTFYNKIKSGVRKKNDIIKIILETIRYSSVVELDKDYPGNMYVSFYGGKSNRVIFEINGDKIFTFRFPFKVNKVEKRLLFSWRDGALIDPYTVSLLMSVFSKENSFNSIVDLDESCSVELDPETNDKIWNIIVELLTYEDGYLRFDYDEQRASEDHPLNHLDIFYSNPSTYKIGTHTPPSLEFLVDLLDHGTAPKFLERHES